MKDRLLLLLTHYRLTATRFADEIGVQRSGISHILSGRNQPSYDFIVKIMNQYPEINLDWLILGKGNMIRSVNFTDNQEIPDLFSLPEKQEIKPAASILRPEPQEEFNTSPEEVTNVTQCEQIVIFYSDGRFKPYTPASKE